MINLPIFYTVHNAA